MKFAFCIFKYFPFGGLERDFIRILEACQQHGHIIDVYTMQWQGETPKGVHIFIIPTKGWSNHARCVSFVANMSKILSEKGYDAIVGFNRMPGLDVCYAADICFEHNVSQNHGLFYRLTRRYKVYAGFERAVFDPQSKTQILYIADQVKKQAVKYYNTPEERFHLLPPGVSMDRRRPENAEQIRQQIRKTNNISDGQKLILLVGSNFKLKGLDRALQAVAALPKDLRKSSLLWVFGKDKPNKYQKLAKKLGIAKQVKFMGLSDEIQRFLLAADLLIHPARREAAGMAIMDAIVAGCPVLATAACGFSFHIEAAQAGLVVPSPFQQLKLNQLLETMLISDQQVQWQQNALLYAATQDLYSRDVAVKVIEQQAKILF